MKDGESLEKETLTKALQSRGLGLISLGQETIAKPEAAYAVTVIGGT